MSTNEEFEIPKSGQMRMPIEIWEYCRTIAETNGFKNPTDAAKQIILAHKGWTTLNPRVR
ncbi:hypothetical protein ACQ4M3_05215 [Leptolyngbya sp. AN03gr2]|uniref:hypothetical protein n=1 Tax=unclassified Leptolyngbya TaxID=2650499 RepID=UPI003D32318D